MHRSAVRPRPAADSAQRPKSLNPDCRLRHNGVHTMLKRKSLHSEPAASPTVRIRRSYFECRFGQLHVHHAIPGGGGFEEGTPLLALHGTAHSGRLFSGLLASLGRDRSVFAPDLPGFGESDAPESLSISALSGAIGDFLEAMRLRQVDVLGCGLGIRIALELAATRAAVRRVVLAAVTTTEMPQPPPSADRAEPFLREVWAGARADLGTDATLAQLCAASGDRLRNAVAAARAAAERLGPPRERLAAISQPLLVLHPADAPHGFGLSAADLPTHARRALCADMAQLQVAAPPVVAAIQDFLTD